MHLSNLWRVFFIASLSLLMSACKPTASFSFSPDPVIVGQVATFDASSTVISDEEALKDENDKKESKNKKKENEKNKPSNAVIYNWNFGDRTSGSGITATHIFKTTGSYTVTLTVVDRDGNVGVISKVVQVTSAVGAPALLNVQVQGTDGVLIYGAQVTVSGMNATTNSQGIATVSTTGGTKTVSVTKTGYVTQAVSTALVVGKTSKLQLIMLPVKEVKAIVNIQAAQLITAKTLNASVLLPANALVNPDGTTAMGTVSLQLTPWDITNTNLYAMLGNGKAKAADGSIINLISAGMITVDFFNAANQHLQLGAGKTANIQMDLPYASINGHALAAGSSIPLWTFNETQGLWIQEGMGTVVVSNTSPVGLAVKATVGHFSTWNWDFWYTNPNGGPTNDIAVLCLDSANQPIACAITADVTLPDGSKFYEHFGTSNTSVAGVEGLTVLSVPINATIQWTGTTQEGKTGTATGSAGTINIQMSEPITSNFVQCTKPDLTPLACDVQLSITKTDGTVKTSSYSIPAQGGRINTLVDSTATLAWVGSSGVTLEGSEYVRYEGASATSGSTGTVSLVMTSRVVELSKTLLVSCDPTADLHSGIFDPTTGTYIYTTSTVAIDTCRIDVSDGNFKYSGSYTVPVGTIVPVLIPPPTATDAVLILASTLALNAFYAERILNFSSLVNNQSINLRFSNFCGLQCT
jgi:PKD domain